MTNVCITQSCYNLLIVVHIVSLLLRWCDIYIRALCITSVVIGLTLRLLPMNNTNQLEWSSYTMYSILIKTVSQTFELYSLQCSWSVHVLFFILFVKTYWCVIFEEVNHSTCHCDDFLLFLYITDLEPALSLLSAGSSDDVLWPSLKGTRAQNSGSESTYLKYSLCISQEMSWILWKHT